jgi:hypothetical protein
MPPAWTAGTPRATSSPGARASTRPAPGPSSPPPSTPTRTSSPGPPSHSARPTIHPHSRPFSCWPHWASPGTGCWPTPQRGQPAPAGVRPAVAGRERLLPAQAATRQCGRRALGRQPQARVLPPRTDPQPDATRRYRLTRFQQSILDKNTKNRAPEVDRRRIVRDHHTSDNSATRPQTVDRVNARSAIVFSIHRPSISPASTT